MFEKISIAIACSITGWQIGWSAALWIMVSVVIVWAIRKAAG